MPLELDHAIVPSRDRAAAARLLASLLDVPWAAQGPVGPFSPVYVTDGLTLDFDQYEPGAALPRLHFCFRVDDARFDAILSRLRAHGLLGRDAQQGLGQRGQEQRDRVGQLHAVAPRWPGRGQRATQRGCGAERDGHVWEVLTRSYERRETGAAG